MNRVGIVGFFHETNTYSGRLTRSDDFARSEILTGDAIVDRHSGTGSVIAGFLGRGAYEPEPLFSARAWPGGLVDRETAEELLAMLEEQIDRASDLDGVLISLHGAMVAESYSDMELEVLRRIRSTLGSLPVVAVLDLHGNPSSGLAAACDVLIGYDTYPHVDMFERGSEAADLMLQILRGRHVRTHLGRLPLLTSPLAQATDREPMNGLLVRARHRLDRNGLARISLLPGFPYSDVDRAGFSVLVVADTGDEVQARQVIRDTLSDVDSQREAFVVKAENPPDAVRQALDSEARPVILVDVADNVGGGSPGDGTELLRELIAQGAEAAVIVIADAETALKASEVGPGGWLEASVGGKTDRLHGSPVLIRGNVLRVLNGHYTTSGSWMTGHEFSMGTTAVIEVGGVTLIVTEHATPPFHREQLTSVGVEPTEAKIIVAKGAVAWRAAYGDIAALAIPVDTPGACPVDPGRLPRSSSTEPVLP